MTLPRVTTFDDQIMEPAPGGWPVEVPPFRDERFRSLWHRIQYLAMRGAQRGVYALPRSMQEAVVRTLSFFGRVFDRRHTEAARTYISAALPAETSAEVNSRVKRAWNHLLRLAVFSEGVSANLLGKRLGDHYDVYMCPEAEEIVKSKTSSIFVTAHVGYWEASCPGVIGLHLAPAYAIGKAPRNDFVAQHIQSMREGQGMRLIPRNGAMAAVPAALRAGAVMGMLLDHRPRQKPVFAPFFGRTAACDRSAGVLLRRVKVPLVFYGCYSAEGTDPLTDWRFDLRFTKVIQPEELAGLSQEEIAARINVELEGLILHRPDEVFWLHDRFKGVDEAPVGTLGARAQIRPLAAAQTPKPTEP